MGATRKFAGIPCGRWSKWGILAFWIVVVAVAASLAGKLNSAQKNDASQWLPKNAESTKVLNEATAFVPSDVTPAVVVYERSGAVSVADQAKAAADAKQFATVSRVSGRVVGPVPSKDGRALEVIVPIKMGANGWKDLAPSVKQIRSIAHDGGGTVYVTGPAGYGADFINGFTGVRLDPGRQGRPRLP